MKFNNKPNKVHTTVEGEEIWDSRSVALNTIILGCDLKYTEFHVLASKRGKGTPDFQGYWNLPAGYLDKNETTSDGAMREVYEETGVNMYNLLNIKLAEDFNNFIIKEDIIKEWETNSDPSNNRENVSFRYGIVFVMDDFSNKIGLTDENSEPDEIDELSWIPLSELKNYKWAFNHDKMIMEYVDRVFNNK